MRFDGIHRGVYDTRRDRIEPDTVARQFNRQSSCDGLQACLANLTKAGLESVTRALAIELAGDGIRFNAIAPGVVNTPMNPVEAHEFLKQLSPMKRLAEVGEVADLLLYLESAQFVNGEVVHLDGGAHAGKW